MCRWISYIGKPIYLDTLVTKPDYSLVSQSLGAKQCFKPDGSLLATNGDGFGIGWYLEKEEPGLFKTAEPAWANENINELCTQIKARIFMAHIRAASTGSIQRTNAHPFKYKNWLFQHNGYLGSFEILRRDLQHSIADEYFSYLKGTTDSETIFLMMLTNGLEKNPKEAIEKTISRIKQACIDKSVQFDLVLSCSLSDGKALYTTRYSSTNRVHSQYYSTHAECMRDINKDSEDMPRCSVVVVSEPLDQSMELWTEMPIGSFATIREGGVLSEAKINIEQLEA